MLSYCEVIQTFFINVDLATMAESQAANKSLLEVAAELRKKKGLMDKTLVKQDRQTEQEQILLKEANQVQTNALQSNEEIATGKRFSERLKTRWKAPQYLLDAGEEKHNEMRKKWHIIVEGENVLNVVLNLI